MHLEHIKNPYLRCKFISVIHSFLPDYSGSDKLGQVMFETNASAFQFLIPNLLKIFADAEQAVGPYEKFNVRREIGDICEYLWAIPEYRNGWKTFFRNQVAILREDLSTCLSTMLFTLLARQWRKLPQIKEREELMADEARWNQLTDEEREDHRVALRTQRTRTEIGFVFREAKHRNDGVYE